VTRVAVSCQRCRYICLCQSVGR